jgi:hypothetical protein
MNNEFNDYAEELEDFEVTPMTYDGHLSDEDILILINVGFDDPARDEASPAIDEFDEFDTDGGPVGSMDLGEKWYPNQRAFQILRAMDPTRGKVEYALRDLIIEIREQSNGDWTEARRLLRIYGLEIAVEYAPLSDTETIPEGDVPTSPLFVEMKRRQGSLLSRDRDLSPTADERRTMLSNRRATVFDPRDIESILGEMAQMEGMNAVYDWSRSLVAQCHTENLRRRSGLVGNLEMPRHLVLRGEPGTGKTVGARLLTELYAALGIVRYPKFIEASRADLVAGYVGHTAIKTRAIVTQALGGVLFIDEAYSLNMGGQDFGDEAVAELIQLMETHRNDVAVFFAGYPVEMEKFIRMNTGLASRVSATLEFAPYSNEELWKVLNRMALIQSFMIDEEAREVVDGWFDVARDSDDFGNARSARHLLNLMKANQAERVYQNGSTDVDDLILLTAADVPEDPTTKGAR